MLRAARHGRRLTFADEDGLHLLAAGFSTMLDLTDLSVLTWLLACLLAALGGVPRARLVPALTRVSRLVRRGARTVYGRRVSERTLQLGRVHSDGVSAALISRHLSVSLLGHARTLGTVRALAAVPRFELYRLVFLRVLYTACQLLLAGNSDRHNATSRVAPLRESHTVACFARLRLRHLALKLAGRFLEYGRV